MQFDHSTLKFAGGFVTMASGLLIGNYWLHDRKSSSALWWSLANLASGAGISVMALHDLFPNEVWQVAGPVMIGFGVTLMTAAAWLFNDRRIPIAGISAAIALWILLASVAGLLKLGTLEIALGPGLSGILCAASATKFWLAREESLTGRTPMILILCIQALALFILVFGITSTAMLEEAGAITGIFGIIQFVQLLYAAGSAVFLTTMLRERTEARYKKDALTDPLTGLLNRRSFLDQAEEHLQRCIKKNEPLVLLAFDLDYFKNVNDKFGHQTGDEVLRLFAQTLVRSCTASDIVARIGGEEFLVILRHAAHGSGYAVADRIRLAFATDALWVNGKAVRGTVSIGVVSTQVDDIQTAIDLADKALYKAKALGRNRAVMSSAEHSVIEGPWKTTVDEEHVDDLLPARVAGSR